MALRCYGNDDSQLAWASGELQEPNEQKFAILRLHL